MSQNGKGVPFPSIERRITSVLEGCRLGGMVTVIAMMLLTVVHTIGRYGFDKPIPGVCELSGYLLVSSVSLVVGYTMLVGGHITIGILVERLSARRRVIVVTFAYVICLVLAIVGVWQSVVRGIYQMQAMQSSSILHIPYFPFIYLLAVGWAVFGLAVVMKLVNLLYRAAKK